MHQHVVDLLACPVCGAGLAPGDGALRCPAGHSFDVARQGYVSLLPAGAPAGGDTPAMVAAREAFLAAGHLAAVVAAVTDAAADALERGPAGALLDLGAGTGRQLAAVLDRSPKRIGLALDRSPAAARRAARAHPRLGAAVCDIWRGLPVRTAAAALVLNVFAPRNGAEIARVLRPGGALVVASPTSRHLQELVGALDLIGVDARKEERLAAALGPHFEPIDSRSCETTMALSHAEVELLVAMGPSARHADPAVLGTRIAALPEPAIVTASVGVATYRLR